MDCSAAKELLSAYYDNELTTEMRSAVAGHLAGCDECARGLAGFQSLSTLADSLVHPDPPAQIWEQLQKELDRNPATDAAHPDSQKSRRWTSRPAVQMGLTIAAVLVLAVGWLGVKSWTAHDDDHQMAEVFGKYLQEFHNDPSSAQHLLLAKYDGQAVDADLAARTVGYRPVVAAGMPEGYTIAEIYVMKMPCCNCVQCLCQREDGTALAIFEHNDKAPEWLGERPKTIAICGGKPCSMVDLEGRVAATWKHGKRYITVVGAQDKEEIDRLVAWFEERRQSPAAIGLDGQPLSWQPDLNASEWGYGVNSKATLPAFFRADVKKTTVRCIQQAPDVAVAK